MDNKDFILLLNKIYNESNISGKDSELQLCFLIYLAYVNSFDGDFPTDVDDMEILLNKYFSKNKYIISDLWGYIKKDIHDSFLELMILVKSFNLQNYRTDHNDSLLLAWANEKLLFNDLFLEVYSNIDFLLEIIDNTSDKLNLKLSNNRLLVIGNNYTYYKKVFSGKTNYSSYTLCPETDYFYCCSLLNTIFILRNNKFQIIKREKDSKEIFPFEEAQFDTIYSFVNNNVFDFEKLLSFTTIGGNGIIFGQPQDKLISEDVFKNIDFPLIADYIHPILGEFKLYVYNNSKKSLKIHAISICISDYMDYEHYLEPCVKCILDNANNEYCQELTKEDFLYSGDVRLDKVFRKADQMDFVFRKIDDIVKLKSNLNIPTKEVPQERIVNSLSDNPFNISMSPKYLLEKDIYDDELSKEIAEKAFFIEKKNRSYLLNPQFYDERYYKIAENIAWGVAVSNKEKTQLECRIMTTPGLLWDGRHGFLKIDCSEEHPICYRYCIFCLDCYQPECQNYIHEIEISEEFDEDFVIYQFTNPSPYTGYILVAPTKEKQHEYYLKKRDEYRLKNADLIKEIREEDMKALSVDLHYLKHDAAQYLSSINSTAHSFMKTLQHGPLALNDSIGAEYTVEDALNNITKSVSHVTEFLKQMTFLTDTLPKRKMMISDLLESFVGGCLKRDYYKVVLSPLSESVKNVTCLLDDRINKVFANILSNAERHAFTDINRNDYELRIEAHRENEMVIITFANNGTRPDSSLTEEGYFTRGLHVGKTGHNGFGGSIIRDTINAQGGIVYLHLNKDEKYPFIIEIKLKIEND